MNVICPKLQSPYYNKLARLNYLQVTPKLIYQSSQKDGMKKSAINPMKMHMFVANKVNHSS